MYVPSFDSMLRSMGIDRATFENAEKITVSKELLKLLLKIALQGSDFNEAGYLRENPDVAEAVKVGDVHDAHLHYANFGYFEGRTGGTPEVDEKWYLNTYSDVAQGVRVGKVSSAKEHYDVIGGAEGRSPNAESMPTAALWKKVMVGR